MDPFEQLAGEKVPPVPAARTFTDGVRRKLHPRLLVLHVIEFAFGATCWAVLHMATALAAGMEQATPTASGGIRVFARLSPLAGSLQLHRPAIGTGIPAGANYRAERARAG